MASFLDRRLGTISTSPLSHTLRSPEPGLPELQVFLSRLEKRSRPAETGDRYRAFTRSNRNINNKTMTYVFGLSPMWSLGDREAELCTLAMP